MASWVDKFFGEHVQSLSEGAFIANQAGGEDV